MPKSDTAVYHGYFNTSPECWSVFTEVLGAEFGNAVIFGQVHQLTVDSYAVQHAGGVHPDKSVAVHLTGLHLVLGRGIRPTNVPKFLQLLVADVKTWPNFSPPSHRGRLTAFDVTCTRSMEGHMNAVRAWAGQVWKAWSEHHGAIADFVDRHLGSRVHVSEYSSS